MHSFSKTKMKRDILIALAILAAVAAIVCAFVFIIRMEPRIIDKNETAAGVV